MPSVLAVLADDIVSVINAGSYSQPVTAARAYVHSVQLKNNDSLVVLVAPKDVGTEWLSRGERERQATFFISVMKRLELNANGLANNADVDSLVTLVEEIDSRLSANRLVTNGSFLSSDLLPPVDGRHLIEWGQFTGVIEATYRVKA